MAEGTVIVIGGAEDKVRDRVILSRFVTLAVDMGTPTIWFCRKVLA